MISAIILTYNEADWIHSIIDYLHQQEYQGQFEILVADGGSTDDTVALAKKRKVKVIPCQKGKALQMNEAAKKARGNILFFVHADMMLSPNTFSSIEQYIVEEQVDAGGFANLFDEDNQKIKRLGTLLNFRFFNQQEQSDRGLFYGDNGIFVKKRVFEALGGFKEIPIMEDYDFSLRLRNKYRTKKIRNPQIILSARRHQKSGFIKTRLQWIFIRLLYKWGVSPNFLVKFYKDVR